MLSLAGRRPGARLYAREDKPSHRSKTTSPSYLRPLHRSYRVEALGPDSIKPLVELGFWSKSVEVRRDSAAALSTLARNPDNLGTLGRSGALGATLSLLISTDDACVRDATLTLASRWNLTTRRRSNEPLKLMSGSASCPHRLSNVKSPTAH